MLFVLVHGIHDTGRKFKTMRAAFEGQGHRCIAPSLSPNNGRLGLEHLANQLQGHILAETAGGNPQLVLVGFSMGGLIARHYLQELGGHRHTSHFFSIAAPHHGTLLAYLSAHLGARQMRPGSPFLHRLAQNANGCQNVACYSYWTPLDLMIVPATSSVWAQAENIPINVLAHALMVRDRRVIGDILAKVGEGGGNAMEGRKSPRGRLT